jgi:hypothetical protein
MADGPEIIDVGISGKPEQLTSTEIVPPGSVGPFDVEQMKMLAALVISGLAVVIGFTALLIAVCYHDDELKTWATGLISLVVGAAIGFAFSTTKD